MWQRLRSWPGLVQWLFCLLVVIVSISTLVTIAYLVVQFIVWATSSISGFWEIAGDWLGPALLVIFLATALWEAWFPRLTPKQTIDYPHTIE